MTTDFTEDRLFFVGTGIIDRVVCAPKSWSPERIAEDVTRRDPPGTTVNRWEISDARPRPDTPFDNTNHAQCPDCDGRMHWLLNC